MVGRTSLIQDAKTKKYTWEANNMQNKETGETREKKRNLCPYLLNYSIQCPYIANYSTVQL